MSGEKPDGCVFCPLLEADEDGLHNLVVRRDPLASVILNRYPHNTGHAMVVPNRHLVDLNELTGEESTALWGLTSRMVDLLRDPLLAEAVNVGVNLGRDSGGSVAHLHVHVVPRWRGDTNFMPIIAGAKVLVETLDDTYRRFTEAMQGWDG